MREAKDVDTIDYSYSYIGRKFLIQELIFFKKKMNSKTVKMVVMLTVLLTIVYVYLQKVRLFDNFQLYYAYVPRNLARLSGNLVDKSSIFFVITQREEFSLQLRAACAIESASLHHANLQIIVATASVIARDDTFHVLHNMPNVRFVESSTKSILKDTPLEEWYEKGSFVGSSYTLTHLSDALRVALLWKFGGIYLDTDVWCLKSLSRLHNTIGAQCVETINGAVMMFDKGHSFLKEVMDEFVQVYDKNEFAVVGPILLSNVLKRLCNVMGNVMSVPLALYSNCCGLTVLPPSVFYPLDFFSWPEYFKTSERNFNESLTVHLWNFITQKERAQIGSEVLLEKLAQKQCPQVYELMRINGTI